MILLAILAILTVSPVLFPLLYIAAQDPSWETRTQARITVVCIAAITVALML